MLPPSVGKMLPDDWVPPCPFPAQVRYLDPGRKPDGLWTMPYLCDNDGNVRLYLAAGPAGQLTGSGHIASIDESHVPDGARATLVFGFNAVGTAVLYAQPNHTMN